MRNLLKIGAMLSAFMAFAAIAMSQDVRTDYDKHASFENYHTYYWEKVQTSNPLRSIVISKPRAGKKWSREATSPSPLSVRPETSTSIRRFMTG